MRRLLLAASIAILPASSAHAACVHRDERVVARSQSAVVTLLKRPGREITHETWFGCLGATGRRRVLARGYETDAEVRLAARFRLAGPFVAYAVGWGDKYENGGTAVHVMDLRSGHRRASKVVAPPDDEDIAYVKALALDASGRAAYLVDDPDDAGAIQVVEGARGRTLDEAPARTLTGPAIEGDRVVWSHGGERREAALAPPDLCARTGHRILLADQDALVTAAPDGHPIGCARAVGVARRLEGEAVRLTGPLVAVRQARNAVRVLDLRSGDWVGPASPSDPITVLLAPSGTLVLLMDRPAYRLLTQAPDGTRRELDRDVSYGSLHLFDGTLTWRGGTHGPSASVP